MDTGSDRLTAEIRETRERIERRALRLVRALRALESVCRGGMGRWVVPVALGIAALLALRTRH